MSVKYILLTMFDGLIYIDVFWVCNYVALYCGNWVLFFDLTFCIIYLLLNYKKTITNEIYERAYGEKGLQRVLKQVLKHTYNGLRCTYFLFR